MASSTQDIETLAATQQASINETIQKIAELIEGAGETANIEAYPVAISYAVAYRKPSGSSLTDTEFNDLLVSLKLKSA